MTLDIMYVKFDQACCIFISTQNQYIQLVADSGFSKGGQNMNIRHSDKKNKTETVQHKFFNT